MAERIELLMTSERRLVESQRRLLGDVSHELRSPLTRLSVALALARHHETAPEAKEAHERIGRETVRLNDMIGQLLQLARLENREINTSTGAVAGDGAVTDDLATIELNALVSEIVRDAQFEAEERGKTVRFESTALFHVRGIVALLQSAVENVVRNAVRFTTDGTAVEVTLRADDGFAIITVRDHGEGVPEAALNELAKPFYRVESARDRESGGVGLGLSITERAVRLHHGTLRISNAAGGGLLVEIRLPLLPGAPELR
jgi:two-component system sensor histidine kinase CpxA